MTKFKQIVDGNVQFQGRRKLSLYSNFASLKTSNTVGYGANISAWKSAFNEFLAEGLFPDKTCITVNDELSTVLYDTTYGIPLALHVVVDELVESGEYVPLSQYRRSLNSGWVGYFFSKLVKPSTRDPGMKYVSIAAVQQWSQRAQAVFDGMCVSYSRSVFTKSLFEHYLRQELPMLSDDDFRCIFDYLEHQRRVVTDGKVVIYKNTAGDTSVVQPKDTAVANLRDTIWKMGQKVDGLSKQIDQCSRKALEATKQKNKTVARYALRSRHYAEQSQEHALGMLEKLAITLDQIDTATGQQQVVDALESGVTILRDLNKTIGGVDRVSELMNEVQEQRVVNDELGEILAGDADADVEEELEQIGLQVKFPSVPGGAVGQKSGVALAETGGQTGGETETETETETTDVEELSQELERIAI